MSAVWHKLRQAYANRAQRWLRERIPPSSKTTLDMRSIFILPSRFGLLYLLVCLVIFLLGTNYQNNLVMGLSFLLFSIFNTCIIFAYRNLSGLTLTAVTPELAQAGKPIDVQLHFESVNDKFAIELDSGSGHQAMLRHVTGKQCRLTLPFPAGQRGRHQIPRFKVISHFPLGLCSCWSRVDLDVSLWLYPKPLSCRLALSAMPSGSDEGWHYQAETAGDDQLDSLIPYRTGESLSRVSWRHLASGRGMWQKSFSDQQSPPVWLHEQQFPASNRETVLSKMSFQVKLLSAQDLFFGMQLGSMRIAPDRGEQHCKRCLQHLAEEPS